MHIYQFGIILYMGLDMLVRNFVWRSLQILVDCDVSFCLTVSGILFNKCGKLYLNSKTFMSDSVTDRKYRFHLC